MPEEEQVEGCQINTLTSFSAKLLVVIMTKKVTHWGGHTFFSHGPFSIIFSVHGAISLF